MIQKKLFSPLFILCSLFFALVSAAAQSSSPPAALGQGLSLYGAGKFTEAAAELRRFTPSEPELYAESLYWVSLAELSAGDYASALQDIETLEQFAAHSSRSGDLPYQKGRILYYLGRYEEAIVVLSGYSARPDISGSSRAAALYWSGECLYSLGQLDKAGDVFARVVEQYPESIKHEAASYRLDLINQKKIEAELLAIIKWSHEESLKTQEEYQRREKTYDQAIVAYQKRVTEMLNDSQGTDDYSQKMAAAELRIAALEASLREANAALEALRGQGTITGQGRPLSDSERALRMLALKAEAQDLKNVIQNRMEGEK